MNQEKNTKDKNEENIQKEAKIINNESKENEYNTKDLVNDIKLETETKIEENLKEPSIQIEFKNINQESIDKILYFIQENINPSLNPSNSKLTIFKDFILDTRPKDEGVIYDIPYYERLIDRSLPLKGEVIIGSIKKCFNCGRPDHEIKDCKLEKDSSEIQKNVQLFQEIYQKDSNKRYYQVQEEKKEKFKNQEKKNQEHPYKLDYDYANDNSYRNEKKYNKRDGYRENETERNYKQDTRRDERYSDHRKYDTDRNYYKEDTRRDERYMDDRRYDTNRYRDESRYRPEEEQRNGYRDERYQWNSRNYGENRNIYKRDDRYKDREYKFEKSSNNERQILPNYENHPYKIYDEHEIRDYDNSNRKKRILLKDQK